MACSVPTRNYMPTYEQVYEYNTNISYDDINFIFKRNSTEFFITSFFIDWLFFSTIWYQPAILPYLQ